MVLGLLRLRLRFVAHSRKEKRAVVKSTVERLRHRYNAAVTEADDLDVLDHTTIAVACLSSDARTPARSSRTSPAPSKAGASTPNSSISRPNSSTSSAVGFACAYCPRSMASRRVRAASTSCTLSRMATPR